MPIRVLIVDDHALLRTGIRQMLSLEADIEVVGEAGIAADAIQLVQETEPDVVLLDLSLPDRDGVDAIADILQQSPTTRILVLTAHDETDRLTDVLASGGHGYIVKSAGIKEVVSAVHAVSEGRSSIIMTTTEKLAVLATHGSHERPSAPTTGHGLSERENEVLGLAANGFTNHQIASQLLLSVKTIETYRSRLMTKLGLKDRSELMRFAMRHGLIQDRDAADHGIV